MVVSCCFVMDEIQGWTCEFVFLDWDVVFSVECVGFQGDCQDNEETEEEEMFLVH